MKHSNGGADDGLTDRLCILAHDLNNKLSIIVGNCDLLAEEAKHNVQCAERLARIRDLALSMARQVNGHECRMVLGPTPAAPSKPPGREGEGLRCLETKSSH